VAGVQRLHVGEGQGAVFGCRFHLFHGIRRIRQQSCVVQGVFVGGVGLEGRSLRPRVHVSVKDV